MDAITVTDDGRLELRVAPDPQPAPGEVLLDVTAAGVNRADLLQRAGHYEPPPGESEILGLEVSGTVAALGPGAEGWQVGDEVCALLTGGGYAHRVAVPSGQLLPRPAATSLVDAAALPEVTCTAWSNLVMRAGLRAGETVLVHGGSGGVGSAAIQIARSLGARVLTTAGGPERTEACRQLGADVAIDHHGDVPAAVEHATDGRGVDVILDVLGAGGLADNLAMLATDGRLVVIGLQRGRRAEINLQELMSRRLTVTGTTLRARPPAAKARIVAEVREHVWPMLARAELRAVVHERLPLADAQAAHELLEGGGVLGKVLLVV